MVASYVARERTSKACGTSRDIAGHVTSERTAERAGRRAAECRSIGERERLAGRSPGVVGEEKVRAVKLHRTENWRRQADPSSQAQGRR